MPELDGRTDGQLLKAFAETRDEGAFAELVRRHGPLVWIVCRRILGRSADVEDASQATFLALARQAPRWRDFPTAGPWLHRVARNIAVKILGSGKARKRREKEVALMTQPADQPQALSDEQGVLLHEELNALPEKHRQAVILFHLEGKSLEEAAVVMACPKATVGTWVARGRERLKDRLAQRGLILSLAVLTSSLSAEAGAAEFPATFVASTTKAAALFVAGKAGAGAGVGASALSSHIASLAEGELKNMFYARLSMAVLVLVLILGIGGGTGWIVSRATGAEGGGPGRDVATGVTKPSVGPQEPRKDGEKPTAVVDAKEPGKEGEKPIPVPGEKDMASVVAGNTAFAVDLFGQLAKENPGKNLFFSPYSMSVALTMTAEGARGETADQMGKVLRFPEAARNDGDEAQMLPWKTTPIHSGMHALYQRFNPKPVAPEMRARIAAIEQALKASQQEEEAFRKTGKWNNSEEQNATSETVVDEVRTLRAQVEEEAFRKTGKRNNSERQNATSRKLADELKALRARVDQYELRVANALYGEKTYPFQPAFMETVNKFYGTGAAVPVDFTHNFEAVRLQINTDVADFTKQRIKDLLAAGSLDDLTRLVLVNAIYFKGEWAMSFEEGATKQEEFLAGANQKVPVAMMHKDEMTGVRYGAFNADGTLFPTPRRVRNKPDPKTLYPGQEGFLMAELPYKGGELCMTVLVPQDAGGLDALEKKLSSANLQNWIGKLEGRDVNVQLPKFKLETDYQKMKETLKALGMVRAFGPGAQFDGMCASSDPLLKLYITKVCHKAFVEVTEKGTEAAAATAVVMGLERARETEPFTPTFRADKPFLFAIRDVKTGSILFLGRMLDPTR